MESHKIFNSEKFGFHESLSNGITIVKCIKDGCKAVVILVPDGSVVHQCRINSTRTRNLE